MLNNESNQKEPAEKKRRTAVILAFTVLIAALAACIVLLLTRKDSEPVQTPETNVLDRGFVDSDNASDIMEEMANKVAEGMFECRMTTEWTFEDSSSTSSDAYVANVESNLNTIYFDVYDNSTDELLYSSPMLPVGTEISGIKLDKELPAGDYDAVVMYTLVDENQEEVSTVGFNITISVLQ